MHKRYIDKTGSYSGFSLVELCVTVALIFIISGFAILGINPIQVELRADKAMYQVLDQLRDGRELAIAHLRPVQVQFLSDNQIQLVRQEIPSGTTVLSTIELSHNYQFMQFGGIPDTGDNFGNSSPVDFGGATSIFFIPDGTLVDGQGDPLNGSIFLGLEDRPETARAVTVMGSTGQVRSYQWSEDSWTQ